MCSKNNSNTFEWHVSHTHLAAIQAEAKQIGDLLLRVGRLCRLAACDGLLRRGGPVPSLPLPSRPLRCRSSRSLGHTNARAGNLGSRHVLGTAHLGCRPTHARKPNKHTATV